MVYSPLDALKIARENPDRQVVFFGIGFETTAPANAMTVYQAKRLGIENFSLLVSHVLVPPAIAAIMESPTCRVQAFLAAGHVCSVMGTGEYPPLAEQVRGTDRGHRIRAARHPRGHPAHGDSAGGRPSRAGERLPARRAAPRATPPPRRCCSDVFEVTDRAWRGIGMIPEQRLAAAPKLPRVRRRAPVLGHRHAHRGVRRSAAPARCCRA